MIHSVPIKRKRRARRLRSTPCKSVKKQPILAEKPPCRAAFWRPGAAGPQRRAPSAFRTRPSSNRWRHTSVPSSSSTGTSSS
ncbi:hypothetical protein DF021_08970 [Burkholderia stagnalis]|uniref:Uncharacterized protein n=1 Tax=Burkholderia stagnalis TaxID=1503054 RepID=A0A3P0LGJ7_9BURK|nr:hypothetical protein F7R25_09645 [Burkholderia stagnalis]RQQ44334.1 hypothetical protein DF145_27365 [Burkholderia stagnalis]RQQ62343.1 hypothetical protein DF158_08810 [Burkholderia stagnalis]RQQ72186.1 hypothetical protein DF137_07130 [Burkholderia stagnalis]RQQ73469.1 hypothetical protein DF139_06225 [Burkholderia stagnalis]